VGDGCCRGRGEAACGCHYALNPTLVEGKGMARGAGAVGEERRSHSEEEGRREVEDALTCGACLSVTKREGDGEVGCRFVWAGRMMGRRGAIRAIGRKGKR
jgi:hypothetical protein